MFLQVALSRLELVYKRDGRLLPFWGRHKLDAIERQTVRATLAQMKPGRSRWCSAIAEVSISKRGRTQFEPGTDTTRFALTSVRPRSFAMRPFSCSTRAILPRTTSPRCWSAPMLDCTPPEW